MIPLNIERKHVARAIREIDSNGIPPGRESKRFLLVFEGRRYPPKYVLSLANKFVNGEELDSSRFSGGQESNIFLKRLGFSIMEISSSRAGSGTRQTEDAFSNEVLSFFQTKLARSVLGDKVEVVSKKNILRDITVGRDPNTNEWKIYFGMQQQDIIFMPKRSSDRLLFPQGQVAFHWAMRNQTEFVIPLLVCELKVPQSMNTHQFITYSKLAEQIKEAHPFCAYYFILSNDRERHIMPETVARQAKSFDRVFLNWAREKTEIWQAAEQHLLYLRDKVKIIPT